MCKSPLYQYSVCPSLTTIRSLRAWLFAQTKPASTMESMAISSHILQFPSPKRFTMHYVQQQLDNQEPDKHLAIASQNLISSIVSMNIQQMIFCWFLKYIQVVKNHNVQNKIVEISDASQILTSDCQILVLSQLSNYYCTNYKSRN